MSSGRGTQGETGVCDDEGFEAFEAFNFRIAFSAFSALDFAMGAIVTLVTEERWDLRREKSQCLKIMRSHTSIVRSPAATGVSIAVQIV
jgi:hypothetical protein